MAHLHDAQQSQKGGEEFGVTNQWYNQEDGRLVFDCLQYLDVVTLIKKKSVSKHWQDLCTEAIDAKCNEGKEPFEHNDYLRRAVIKYSPNNSMNCTPTATEKIASTYGYPIDKWDVSNVKDFSFIFQCKQKFNEPIGSWDVSNATKMEGMFAWAHSFNQDVSSWDVSNVESMQDMFCYAKSFNEHVSSWDVSSVKNMDSLFYGASSFNQDLSSWDVSSVSDMGWMFYNAKSFDQDLSSWNISNVKSFKGMFYNCLPDAERLPWFTEISNVGMRTRRNCRRMVGQVLK